MNTTEKSSFWLKPIILFQILYLVVIPLTSISAAPEQLDSPESLPEWYASDETSTYMSPEPAPQQRSGRRVFVPGDAVRISIFPDSSFLNNVFPIDDRGFIDLPKVGKAKISHMSSEEFKNFLRENFREYALPPQIQVRPLIRASVHGGVTNPGLFYIDPDRSLWELVQLAGPMMNEDGLMESRWDRDRNTIQEDLIPHIQSGVSLKRMGFQSGDQIWVKSPDRPGLLDKVLRVSSLLTIPLSVASLWLAIDRNSN